MLSITSESEAKTTVFVNMCVCRFMYRCVYVCVCVHVSMHAVRGSPTACLSLYNTSWLRQVQPDWEETVSGNLLTCRSAQETSLGLRTRMLPGDFAFLLDQRAGVRPV